MEWKYDIIKYRHEDLEALRKEYNLDTEAKRDEAFRILEEWLLKQDHLIKKTYSRDYLERCIGSCNGSIEKAKLQIDRMCTMRTLHPKYFQISSLKDSKLMETFNWGCFGFASRLTKKRYRVAIIKLIPNNNYSSDYCENLFKFSILTAEFLKSNEVADGFIIIFDFLEANFREVIKNLNLLELQQFMPILTTGYGCKIKGIIYLSPSKLLVSFINIIKSVVTEKIRNRLHAATGPEQLKDFLHDEVEVLPVEYGGNEKPLKELHDDLLATLLSKPVQELLKEMNMARTDESRRQTDKFNDQHMGMAGTFRTITLD